MNQMIKLMIIVGIGFIIFQFFLPRESPVDGQSAAESQEGTPPLSQQFEIAQNLRNRYIHITNAVHIYYKKHKELPESLRDLDCKHQNSLHFNISSTLCATGDENGVYYTHYKDDWITAEPYLDQNKLKFHCQATFLNDTDPRFSHCVIDSKLSIPSHILASKSGFE